MRLAGRGRIAVDHSDGSLWLIDAAGTATMLESAADGSYGFPAWSPDGTRIAVARADPDDRISIVVIDVGGEGGSTDGTATAPPPSPRVIFQNPEVQPFYLYWTPDSRTVSFLANEGGGLTFRVVPADGSAPIGGGGPSAVVRTGSPFYFDWIGSDRVLAHIGTGSGAFLGEIGRNGAPIAPAITNVGEFRSAVVSGDGRFVGYVRVGRGDPDSVVLANRDGTKDRSASVYGMAALEFDPTGDRLAAIGPATPPGTASDLPIGPLRVLDPVSPVRPIRTLLDGSVVGFTWSPDGRTIAALRVVPVPGGSTVASVSPAPSPQPSPVPANEVRLTFVDVASDTVRSDPVVVPGATYIGQVLTYFDQYALSHRLWAPDSSSILLPAVDDAGTTHVDAFFPGGGQPVPLEGEVGFWSP
jgi:TolB protein